MSTPPAATPVPVPAARSHTSASRLARSAGTVPSLAEFERTVRDTREHVVTNTEMVPLDRLHGWHYDEGTGFIAHESGRFFSVEGLQVETRSGLTAWGQPIINQPETGILGFLAKEIDGVLHFLMQLKAEPGNRNGLQLSPTVQATKSNYTGIHGGLDVPYLEFFQDPARRRVIADVRQSEQGSRFLRKRNRNMVVDTREPVEARDGFVWLTLGQLHRLMSTEDLMNMSTRSVLACLPLGDGALATGDEGFATALVRSLASDGPELHSLVDVLSWITEARTRSEMHARTVPLDALTDWEFTGGRITHRAGRHFDVVGVRVEAVGREVGQWWQPMIRAQSTELAALLVTRVRGVLHVLMQLRAEPGLTDTAELAPTVQYTPDHYAQPPEERPPFLDLVQNARAADIRFDTVLSDEGGRFYHTGSRHVVVETGWLPEPPEFRWLTLAQLEQLTQHSHYLNMQARSVLACLRSLFSGGDR
ncbi:NDP-hexose 2,3-dehydratase family protein [Actinoalloteichus sp. GBA129-24]|uniref:NDP-hexose 2,3-dehydratase family protein n=1 Tax=Actinoalloteichus sp. GBA129-24 TaxID=1612551 RepID=UPI0009505782|nr:NDP-hexose 2,3-dehydratase family protein [Actinoalloteichus sp. GBA129-24]APU21375.1 NDP-hexose 2,3-dehydratase [Actinoalloteichus sp. GBA129-24]